MLSYYPLSTFCNNVWLNPPRKFDRGDIDEPPKYVGPPDNGEQVEERCHAITNDVPLSFSACNNKYKFKPIVAHCMQRRPMH